MTTISMLNRASPHHLAYSRDVSRRLLRHPTPAHPSLVSAGAPIISMNLSKLRDGQIVGTELDEDPKDPLYLFTRLRREAPPPESHFLPVMPARWLAAFSKSMGRSGTEKGLVRLTHGWYATRSLSTAEMLRALMLIVPEDTVVAAETAGLLWGVEVRPTSDYGEPFRMCVARPEGHRALRRPGLRCRVVRLEPRDVVTRYGIRCTSALRTALDLAASSTLDVATRVLEEFLRRGLVTFQQLRSRIDNLGGTRGVVTLRAALELADPKSESIFETAVRLRLIEAGLPAPVPQIPVHVPGRVNPFRLDLGWEYVEGRPVHVGVECDSDSHHPLTGPKAEADHRRAQKIRARGWKLLSIRFSSLRGFELNFERRAAELLDYQLRVSERRKWSLSKWNLRRNAWVRSEERQLLATVGKTAVMTVGGT